MKPFELAWNWRNFSTIPLQRLTFFNDQTWRHPHMAVFRNVRGTIALRFISKCEVSHAWHLNCWLWEDVWSDNQRDCWWNWDVVVVRLCVVVPHLFIIDPPPHRRNPVAPYSNHADHAHRFVLNYIINCAVYFLAVQHDLTDWICSWSYDAHLNISEQNN